MKKLTFYLVLSSLALLSMQVRVIARAADEFKAELAIAKTMLDTKLRTPLDKLLNAETKPTLTEQLSEFYDGLRELKEALEKDTGGAETYLSIDGKYATTSGSYDEKDPKLTTSGANVKIENLLIIYLKNNATTEQIAAKKAADGAEKALVEAKAEEGKATSAITGYAVTPGNTVKSLTDAEAVQTTVNGALTEIKGAIQGTLKTFEANAKKTKAGITGTSATPPDDYHHPASAKGYDDALKDLLAIIDNFNKLSDGYKAKANKLVEDAEKAKTAATITPITVADLNDQKVIDAFNATTIKTGAKNAENQKTLKQILALPGAIVDPILKPKVLEIGMNMDFDVDFDNDALNQVKNILGIADDTLASEAWKNLKDYIQYLGGVAGFGVPIKPNIPGW